MKPYHTSIDTPEDIYAYMAMYAPGRGGYMFEGVRERLEAGEIIDEPIAELLNRGWIVPHPDPKKGWVPVIHTKEKARCTQE